MIYLEGIWLKCKGELHLLHRFARDMGISKSWFSSKPYPHYEIISGYMIDRIMDCRKIYVVDEDGELVKPLLNEMRDLETKWE